MAASSVSPPAPALAGRDLGPELTPLEARVSAHPNDSAALEELAEEYLTRGAPGLAQAALDRAPEAVRARPAIADARARSLSELGLARLALTAQKDVLSSCEQQPCSRGLVGRAERRARFLTQMVRLGVEDPSEQPNRALLAYRLAVREVSLDMR
jgi:hypothetical protein